LGAEIIAENIYHYTIVSISGLGLLMYVLVIA